MSGFHHGFSLSFSPRAGVLNTAALSIHAGHRRNISKILRRILGVAEVLVTSRTVVDRMAQQVDERKTVISPHGFRQTSSPLAVRLPLAMPTFSIRLQTVEKLATLRCKLWLIGGDEMRNLSGAGRANGSLDWNSATEDEMRPQSKVGHRDPLVMVTALLLSLAVGSAQTGGIPPSAGSTAAFKVFVETVRLGSAGDRAGLQVGDGIFSWSRETDSGQVKSPFDWMDFEIQQIPRGPTTLHGARDYADRTWALPNGVSGLGMRIRPWLRPDLLSGYRRCRELEDNRKFTEAAAGWHAIVGQIEPSDPVWLAPWFKYQLAQALASAGQFDESDAVFQEATDPPNLAVPNAAPHLLQSWGESLMHRGKFDRARQCFQAGLDAARKQGSPNLAEAVSLNSLGVLEWRQGALDQAEDNLRQSLAIRRKLAPESVEVSASLTNLGILASVQKKFDQAKEYYLQALAIQEKIAPGGLAAARTLHNLASSEFDAGDLEGADKHFGQALSYWQKSSPNSLETAATLLSLGQLAEARSELSRAEAYYRQALVLRRELSPGSVDVAWSLTTLGNVAAARGDLAHAEDYYQQALAIWQKVAPESTEMATGLYNLGALEDQRGEETRAAEYFQQALAIWRKTDPNGLDVASALNGIGETAAKGGDLSRADDYLQQALSTRQKTNPDGLRTADSLNNLGELKLERGDFDGAAEYFQQALAIFQKVAPESLRVAQVQDNLAELSAKRGDNARAEGFYRQALAVQHELAPGSLDESKTLHSLGVVMRASGQIDKSYPFLVRAVDALESQTARLGGSQDVRSTFRAQYAGYYGDLEIALLDLKKPEQAYQVSERSRARSLLQMLAERDLVLSSEVPTEIERARKLNATDYDRVQAELAQLNPTKDRQKVDGLLTRLRDLSDERGQIVERIRGLSPRLAFLLYPQPLDLAAARRVLDPGTTLLSFGVFEDRTVLFIVQPEGVAPGFSAVTIQVPEKELRTKVQAFRHLIGERRQSTDRDLMAQSRGLYDLLIKPAEPLIKGSDRLLIVSDGPLQILPFAALRRSEKEYLVEWKPLHTVVSATVYAELKKARRQATKPIELVAFGDPRFPSNSMTQGERTSDAELRSATDRGLTLSPLFFSRVEVDAITSLYPGRSQKYEGAEATEERAKSVGTDVRYIHFSTHGFLDEHFPLNSALVLSIPEKFEEGKENGLLQAWEIFEQVHLDADLVTMSACNTGLGQELNGEGLIGLTRAFEYAGAHSVLASLWSVDDMRTMELMKGFYGGLLTGKSKDEALREAQLGLLRSQPSSSPYYWAAFTLTGDWR